MYVYIHVYVYILHIYMYMCIFICTCVYLYFIFARAFASSKAVSQLETSDMHTKILARVENRALANEERHEQVRKQVLQCGNS